MTAHVFILVIETLVCAALLVWFFSRPWQSLWTAVSRQHLFELRDRLFDIAADERIEFSNPVYCQLREYLNGCIRFTHKITFGSFVAGVICLGSQIRKKYALPEYNLPEAIENVADEKVRQEMREIFLKSVFVLLRHTVIRSPFLWLLLCLYPLIIAFLFVSNKVSDMADRIISHFKWLILAQADLDSSLTPRSRRANQLLTG